MGGISDSNRPNCSIFVRFLVVGSGETAVFLMIGEGAVYFIGLVLLTKRILGEGDVPYLALGCIPLNFSF